MRSGDIHTSWPVGPSVLSPCGSPRTCGYARNAFALLTVVTLLWSTRLCRPSGFSLCCSGLICGCACCTFDSKKSRARLYLRELVLPIAVDIQCLQISFRFTDRGDLPMWSTRLCRLEGPSRCCLSTYDWAGCTLLWRYACRRSRWADRDWCAALVE